MNEHASCVISTMTEQPFFFFPFFLRTLVLRALLPIFNFSLAVLLLLYPC